MSELSIPISVWLEGNDLKINRHGILQRKKKSKIQNGGSFMYQINQLMAKEGYFVQGIRIKTKAIFYID